MMKPVLYTNWLPDQYNSSHSCACYSSTMFSRHWSTRDCADLANPFCELSVPEEDKIFPGRNSPPSPTIEDFVSPRSCLDINPGRRQLCMYFVKLQYDFDSARNFCEYNLSLKWNGNPLPTGKSVTDAIIKLMGEAT